MHTRTVANFAEYVGFIADHVSENWRGYTKDGPRPLRLENIFGEPISYPVTVGVEWEWGDRGALPRVGSVELRPVINKFKP